MLLYYYVGTGVCPNGTEGTLSSPSGVSRILFFLGGGGGEGGFQNIFVKVGAKPKAC